MFSHSYGKANLTKHAQMMEDLVMPGVPQKLINLATM